MVEQFAPNPKQLLAYNAAMTCDETGFGGARGPGKTVWLIWMALVLSLKYPGNAGVIARRDLVDLKVTTLEEFKKFIARYMPTLNVKWNMSPPIHCKIECGNGVNSMIWWVDTKDPDSLRSLNAAWCGIDESEEVADEWYLMISAALGRHLLPDGVRPPRKILWASNPGPGWCRDMFPVGAIPKVKEIHTDDFGTKRIFKRAFVPALPSDNPHLPDGYEADLRSKYPDDWVKRWLEGDWDAFEGQIFKAFSEHRHARKPFSVGDTWRHFTSMDWGFRNPTAILSVHIDSDGKFWVLDEYRDKERTPEYYMPIIRGMERVKVGKWEQPVQFKCIRLIDPAAVDQSTGVTIREQFCNLGLPMAPWRKKKHGGHQGSMADGTIAFVIKLLEQNRLFIHPKCRGLIKELKEARWATISPTMALKRDAPEQMEDKNDHSIDALFGVCEWWRSRGYEADDHEEVFASELERVVELNRRDPGIQHLKKRRKAVMSGIDPKKISRRRNRFLRA